MFLIQLDQRHAKVVVAAVQQNLNFGGRLFGFFGLLRVVVVRDNGDASICDLEGLLVIALHKLDNTDLQKQTYLT